MKHMEIWNQTWRFCQFCVVFVCFWDGGLLFEKRSEQGFKLRTLADPVQLSSAVVHISALPPAIRAAWKGPPRHAVCYLYKQNSEQSQLSWDVFWQDLGCWPLVSLQHPSPNVPLWQSESEDFVHIVEALRHMSSTGPVAQAAAQEMVKWLAPHGTFYAKYFPDKANQISEKSFADVFCNSTWMPSWRKTRLLSPFKGWILRNNCKRFQEYSSNEFLSSHCFDQAVEEFATQWKCIDWVYDKPTATILCDTLGSYSDCPVWMSHDQAIQLYNALQLAMERERIKAEPSEEEIAETKVSQEVRDFLKNKPWIFLPDSSSRAGAYENYWEQHQGRFFLPSNLAFRDRARVFLEDQYLTAEMGKVIAEAVELQALGGYYYRAPRLVRQVFRDWGVRPHVGWDAYLQVLRSVDKKVDEMGFHHVWQDDQVYHEIVWKILFHLGHQHLEEELPGQARAAAMGCSFPAQQIFIKGLNAGISQLYRKGILRLSLNCCA